MNIVSMDQKRVHDKPTNDLRWAAVRDFFQKQGDDAADRGDADDKADRANRCEIEDILASAPTSNRDNGCDDGGNTRRKPSRHHRGSSMLCPREIEQLRGSAEEKHVPANLDLSLDVSNHSTVSEVTWMTYRDENAKEELYRQISERMARAKRHLEVKRPDTSAARGQAEATSDEKTAVVRGAGNNGASLTRKLSERSSRRFSNSDPGGPQRGFDLDDIYGQDEKEKTIPPLSRKLEKKEGKKPPTMTLDQMLHLKQFDQLKKSNLQLPMKQIANVEIATSSPTQGKMGRSDGRKSPERISNLKYMEEPQSDWPSQDPTQPSTPPKSKHISYREQSLNPALLAKQLGVPHVIQANNIELLGNISSITEANNASFNFLENIKHNKHSSTDLSARIHEIIDLKLQIANQQETIDRLSSNLNRADKKNDGLNNQLVECKLMRAQLEQNVEDSNVDPRGEVSSKNSTPRASLLIEPKNNSCHKIIVQEGVGNNDSNSSSNHDMNLLLTKNMELTSENAQLKQEVHDLRKEFQLLLRCINENSKHDAGARKKIQQAAERGRQALGGSDDNIRLSTSMREASERSSHSRSTIPVHSTSTFTSSNYKKNKNNMKKGGDSELDDNTKMKMTGTVPGNNTPNESGGENGSSCDEDDDHIIPTYRVANTSKSCSRRLSLPEKMESFKCNIISSGVTHALQGWVSSRSDEKEKRIGTSEEESYCGNEEDLFQERVPVRETYSRMKSIRANLMQECGGYKPQSAPGMTIDGDVAGDGCDTKGWISRRCSA
mmetsp:Transcript_11914/g.24221  ORF Transcript_11914/g.24221 Transcript_11914/m.24221 type:complete len:778 (+) Transcript_11914:117-2450(+)